MFLQASCENLQKGMHVWDQFATAFGLCINWRKIHPISCIERVARINGSKRFKILTFGVSHGTQCYKCPIKEWMINKLRDKFIY